MSEWLTIQKTPSQKIGTSQRPLLTQMQKCQKTGMKKTMVNGKPLPFLILSIKELGDQRKLITPNIRENGNTQKLITQIGLPCLTFISVVILNTSLWKSGKSRQEPFLTTFLSLMMKPSQRKREMLFLKPGREKKKQKKLLMKPRNQRKSKMMMKMTKKRMMMMMSRKKLILMSLKMILVIRKNCKFLSNKFQKLTDMFSLGNRVYEEYGIGRIIH